MIYSVNTKQMSKAEILSEQKGVSRVALMQNAAEGCFEFISARLKALGKDLKETRFAIICGSGNNGGDGMELSYLLTERGAKTSVILTSQIPDTETAKACIEKHSIPLSTVYWQQEEEKAKGLLNSADIIVDCVFGTGFHGELDANVSRLFDFTHNAENCRALKISADIPSGINGNTGIIASHSFQPDITLVLAAMKTGLLNYPCRDFCGEICIIDIGISCDCYTDYDGIFTDNDILKYLPKRKSSANKGSFGKLLNIAGSSCYRGAALLSSRAALRIGTGLVTLASVKECADACAVSLPECVFNVLPQNEKGFIDKSCVWELEQRLKNATAVSLGCGIGNTSDGIEIVDFVLKNTNCPIILDADGINCLKNNINVLKDNSRPKAPLIMTPHPGEFARLTGKTAAEIQWDRLNLARSFACEYNVILLLKGENTIIAAPDGRVYINGSGNNALAKAGCGDVLTGIIAGLAAQGTDPFYAAVLGAYLHGKAADSIVKRKNPACVLASEVAEELCVLPELR